jgi:phosphocarrier protein
MGVMMLAAGIGSEIEIETDGADDAAAMAAPAGAHRRQFGEGQ